MRAILGLVLCLLLASGVPASAQHLAVTSGVASGTSQASGSAAITAPNSTASFTMAGLGGSFTPTKSGRALIIISGYLIDASNAVVNVGITYQISHGTGTAPTANAALTGTQDGSVQLYTAPVAPTAAADVDIPFSIQVVVTGLTVNTAYWVDLAQKAITTASQYGFKNVSVSVVEI